MKIKTLLSLFLFFLFSVATSWAEDVVSNVWTGSGTETDPYIITSTEGLDLLAQKVNSGNQYKNTYFELGADIKYDSKPLTIDLDGDGPNLSNYTPIGNSSADFWGKFDGKGHTISGIVVKSSSDYVGLFGYVNGPSTSIKNLTLANSSIEGNNYVGGIVGNTNLYVVIENCHVSDVRVEGLEYVGGIVGQNWGNIRGSTSDATVSGREDVGGVVGDHDGGFVENSLYYGTSVTAANNRYVGAISGVAGGSFTNNYHTLSGMGGVGNTNSATGKDVNGARKAVALSAVDGVTLTLAGNPVNYDVSGITAYEKDGKISSGILYGGVLYAGETEDVMLNLGYTVSDYEVLTGYTDGNGNALAANDDGTYTLTMKSAAATVTPAIKYLWGEGTKGTAENPYIIISTAGLDLLAQKVNNGEDYENTYFELGADITYVPVDADNDGEYDNNFTPIGFEDLFYGKFDGKGHTVSGIVVNADQMGVGLFGHVAGSASIKNLTLANSSFVSNQNNMGGIVGAVWGADVVIENCHVSAGVSVTGATFLGGIVGYNIGTINGCTSEAKVSGTQAVGGIVGNNLGVIENNLYLGNSVTATDKNKVGAIAGYVDRGHPDCKASFTNNYHTLSGMGGVGNTESATGEDTDDAMLAKVVTEKPTDIGKAGTPYGTDDYVGITPYTRGLEYKDHFYYKPLWKGNGTEDEPYIITSTEGLDKLASDVNSGNQYKNTYFELGADITYEPKNLTVDLDNNSKNESNFTPIGYNNKWFIGSFDGKGHTVSGIVVESNSDYVGLFGYVGSSVSIKNLTLANSSIKGNNNVGGIVGYVAYSSDTDPFVENCHVSANVLVKGGQYVGGIAGYNSEKIIGCTSDANVSGNEYVGGIVGENGGLVKNSLYLGKSVTATENSRVGAIAGYVSYGGSFTNNYHTLEGKGGEGNYTNMGGDTEGAEFAAPFSVEPAGIGTDETSYGTGDYVGITPYTNGLAYKGRYYYAGTLVEGYAAVQIFKDAEDKKHAIIDGEYDGPDAVNIEEDIDVTSVTFNREFTPNSGYATIMFPFNVNASSLTGVRSVIEFDGIKTDENDNKMVGMKYVWCDATLGEQEGKEHPERNCNNYSGELKAYTPYMVDMKSATLGIEGEITLKPNSGKTVGDASKDNWVFRGALQKKEWPKGTGIINEGRLWAFAAAERSGAKIGEFVQFGGNNWANPFRAYLVECKKSGEDSWDCSDEDSETQPSLVSKYRFADALAPTDSVATDQPLVMRQAAASETASLNSMDIVIVYGDKDSDGDKERPTVIGRYNPATGEIRMLPRTKQTYDLKGRRVGNGKKAKGAYYRR